MFCTNTAIFIFNNCVSSNRRVNAIKKIGDTNLAGSFFTPLMYLSLKQFPLMCLQVYIGHIDKTLSENYTNSM